jgi:hypothetical protein
MRRIFLGLFLILMVASTEETFGKPTVSPPAPLITYADTADLALASQIVAEVRIVKASRVDGKKMPMPAGMRRFLVNANVTALIRGSEGLPPNVSYLVDIKSDSLGRFPSLKKTQAIIFALPVASRPAEVRLVAPDAQQPASPILAAQVRAILAEALGAEAPPRILRVGEAFHVPGAIPGEGETQIFLTADDGRPLSLSIQRNPESPPRWSVSLGEVVNDGAEPPKRDTLLWYRLACFLPQALPLASVDQLETDDAKAASEDYAVVMRGLGPCPRTR